MKTDFRTLLTVAQWCAKHAPDAGHAEVIDLLQILTANNATPKADACTPRRIDDIDTEPDRMTFASWQAAKESSRLEFNGAPLFPPTKEPDVPFVKQTKAKKARVRGATLTRKEVGELTPIFQDRFGDHYHIHVPTGHIISKCLLPGGPLGWRSDKPTYHHVKLPAACEGKGLVTQKLTDANRWRSVCPSKDWRYSFGGQSVTGIPRDKQLFATAEELWSMGAR
jgi:hypothetical protein